MKEYIEREAALKNQRWNGRLDEYVVFVRDIEAIPAADVVEIVRCGKCIHRDEKTGWCDDVQDYISNTNWFCAGGEKKDGADDAAD